MNWLVKQGDETCMYRFCLLVLIFSIIEIEPYESEIIEMNYQRNQHQQNLSIVEPNPWIAIGMQEPRTLWERMIEMKHKRKRHQQNLYIMESNLWATVGMQAPRTLWERNNWDEAQAKAAPPELMPSSYSFI